MSKREERARIAAPRAQPDDILPQMIDVHRNALADAARDLGLAAITLYAVLAWLVRPVWLPLGAGLLSAAGLLVVALCFRSDRLQGQRARIARIIAEYGLALIPLFLVTFLSAATLPDESRLSLLFLPAMATAVGIITARYLPRGPRAVAITCGIALVAICARMTGFDIWTAGIGLILMTCLMAGVAEYSSGDLAERLLAGKRGRAAELSLADYQEQAMDRLFSIDPAGRLQDTTARFARMASRRETDLENSIFVDLFTAGQQRDQLAAHIAQRTEFSDLVLPIDIRGEARKWSVSARPRCDDADMGMRGVVRDVTAEQAAEARIARLAHYDPVTDLPNRLTLEKKAAAVLSAVTPDQPCALIFIDVDHFKVVNDEFGHRAGDAVLHEIASRLRNSTPNGSIVARMGGDEFAILLPEGADPVRIGDTAQNLVDGISRPISHDGLAVHVTVSIGVAIASDRNMGLTDLLHHADLALYAAKENGRNGWRLYDRSMGASERQRHALLKDMETALERRQFQLYYQPLVDARTQEIRGFESLLRWIHPTRGFISPAEFIPAAEESGFIEKLGKWVIETAVREAATWPGNLTVAVNVSPVQLSRDGLEHIVADALRKANLQPPRLELEITEGVLLQESKRVRALLDRVRSLGVRFSLDDFGTGFSSLSYLRTFLFHKIKIDRSFVIDMQADRNCNAIIKAVIAMARDMGMTTVAEGIELPGQLAALQALGCNQIQGYLTGRPMPGEDVAKLLRIEQKPAFTGFQRHQQ